MAKFLFLALIATFCSCLLGAYCIKMDAYPAAVIVFAFGMWIVFTLGRVCGMEELYLEIKEHNESAQS